MNLVSENETIRVSLFQIPGFFFLCHSCQDGTVNFTQRNLPKSSNKLIAHVPKDPPNGDEETNITIQPALPLKDSTNDKTKSSLSIQEDSSILTKQTPKRSLPSLPNVIIANQNSFPISSTKYAGRTEYMRKKLQREKDNNSVLISEDSRGAIDLSRVAEPQTENTNPQNEASNNIVCRFYKKGRCKHGLHGRNCIYYHPKACSKLLKFGNKVPKGCLITQRLIAQIFTQGCVPHQSEMGNALTKPVLLPMSKVQGVNLPKIFAMRSKSHWIFSKYLTTFEQKWSP